MLRHKSLHFESGGLDEEHAEVIDEACPSKLPVPLRFERCDLAESTRLNRTAVDRKLGTFLNST